MHQENESREPCLRYQEFRCVFASVVTHFTEFAAATVAEVGGNRARRYSGRAGVEDSESRCLRFGPAAVRHWTHPFFYGDEPIGRNLLEAFVQAI